METVPVPQTNVSIVKMVNNAQRKWRNGSHLANSRGNAGPSAATGTNVTDVLTCGVYYATTQNTKRMQAEQAFGHKPSIDAKVPL
jgi:hypothetical protein